VVTIAIFGAAGAMGSRLSRQLRDDQDYRLLFVEAGEPARAKLAERGDAPTLPDAAAHEADVVVLAVPDSILIRVAASVVPEMKSGALLICLDPAAPYSGRLPLRDDISYFVTHPAHPPVFGDETDPAARRDFFGSGQAKQAIVSALMKGPEEHFALGEAISKKVFGPILRSHRVTVEQMAMLEPALSETVAATCLTVIREAMDEAIRRGVPAAAARDFLLGHINIELAILFEECQWQFSAGCKLAIEEAKREIFRPDWKKVFDPAHLRASVDRITGGESSAELKS
jgi:hypothetical protein